MLPHEWFGPPLAPPPASGAPHPLPTQVEAPKKSQGLWEPLYRPKDLNAQTQQHTQTHTMLPNARWRLQKLILKTLNCFGSLSTFSDFQTPLGGFRIPLEVSKDLFTGSLEALWWLPVSFIRLRLATCSWECFGGSSSFLNAVGRFWRPAKAAP